VLRVGIDVGGTHTDAVLIDGDRLLSSTKTRTTADVISGVTQALEVVLEGHPGVEAKVAAVMLGTTQFTNAVVERRHLAPVGAIRLAAPSGHGIHPTIGWPADLATEVGTNAWVVPGGYLYDGRPLAPLDLEAIDAAIGEIANAELDVVAVTSAFSPMNAEPETEVAARIVAALPDVRVVCSHDLGRLGILERENAASPLGRPTPCAARGCSAG